MPRRHKKGSQVSDFTGASGACKTPHLSELKCSSSTSSSSSSCCPAPKSSCSTYPSSFSLGKCVESSKCSDTDSDSDSDCSSSSSSSSCSSSSSSSSSRCSCSSSSSSSSSSRCSCSKSVTTYSVKFDITLADKKGHHWENLCVESDKVFHINGKAQRVLVLKRDVAYRFNIIVDSEKDYPQGFFFADHPMGGSTTISSLPGTPGAVSSGPLDVKFTKDHPDIFCYHSNVYGFNGGYVKLM